MRQHRIHYIAAAFNNTGGNPIVYPHNTHVYKFFYGRDYIIMVEVRNRHKV